MDADLRRHDEGGSAIGHLFGRLVLYRPTEPMTHVASIASWPPRVRPKADPRTSSGGPSTTFLAGINKDVNFAVPRDDRTIADSGMLRATRKVQRKCKQMHAKHANDQMLNDLSRQVIGCALTGLNTLGAGFLAKVCEDAPLRDGRAASL